MEIDFVVGDRKARFQRDRMTGKARLTVAGKKVEIASPWSPFTHFSLTTTRRHHVEVHGHKIEVDVVRRRLLAAFRPMDYTVRVDGVVVAEATGK